MIRLPSVVTVAFVSSLVVSLAPSVLAQQVHIIDRDQVNIRADATTQSREVAALRRGVEVIEVGRHAGWIQIQMVDGGQGWVHGQLVLARFVVAGQGVRLREGPSTGRSSVTMLFRGQQVDRIGAEQGGWTQIRIADGRTGWLATRFLRPKTSEDATPQPEVAAEPAVPPDAPVPDLEFEPEVLTRVQRNPYAEGLQREAGGEHRAALEAITWN